MYDSYVGCFRFHVSGSMFDVKPLGARGIRYGVQIYIFLAPSIAFLAVHFMFPLEISELGGI